MSKSNVAPVIDELGYLQAEIANLAEREAKLKNELRALGPGAHEGELFRVTVSTSVRETLDLEAVRERLSRQFIKAHTKEKIVTTVKVTARTGEKEAA